MVTLADIVNASYRIGAHLQPTPLEFAPQLGEHVHLKLENLNFTRSFKIRGAINAMLSLSDDERLKGIVAASSGNHAQGIAYASYLTKTHAKIFVPRHTPQKKIDGIKRWGAEVITTPENYDEAEHTARQTEKTEGRVFVSPYNDAHVVAGTGTIGLEIVRQLPGVGRVVVCVGGGGLISGIGTAIKALRPYCEVVGICAESAPAMANHINGTHLKENWHTLAEALSGDIEAGSITLDIAPKVVDTLYTITEAQIAGGMRFMAETMGYIVEGGGCVGVGAWLAGVIPNDDVPTAIVISGGNVDMTQFLRVLAES